MGKNIITLPIFIPVFILFFLFVGVFISFPGHAGDEVELVGDETCTDCHDEIVANFDQNAHKVHGANDGYLCESCHSSAAAHAEDGDEDLMYNPETEYDATKDNACLSCHNGSDFESMEGSAHYDVANGCSDCHSVHTGKNDLLKKHKSKLCQECHTDVYAQLNLPSRHPVKEGLMDCDDCHNVHGGDVAHTTAVDDNELCFTCHASKEGPFVFEHEPASEDCNMCHTPHGSVVNNLLVESEPALCLSCHPMHFHTELEGWDGAFASTPFYPERTGVSTEDAWKRGMLTKCTQCHTAIHGSDLPSQAIGTSTLTR